MQLSIKFDGDVDVELSNDLQELGQKIEEDCGILLTPENQKSPIGTKDSGLTIGLAIAGLALSGIQTIIPVLQYWQSQKPKYNILIRCKNETYILSNASKEEMERIMQVVRYLPNDVEEIEVKISKK